MIDISIHDISVLHTQTNQPYQQLKTQDDPVLNILVQMLFVV